MTKGHRSRRRAAEAALDDTTRYTADFTARVFVHLHPNGATLELVGAMFGLTRERIRQVEKEALEKLRKHCARHGISPADIFELRRTADAREAYAERGIDYFAE